MVSPVIELQMMYCYWCFCFESSGSEEENDDSAEKEEEEEKSDDNKQEVEISDNEDIDEDDAGDDNEREMKTDASLTVGELIEAMKTKKKLQISQPSSVVSCVICLYFKNDLKKEFCCEGFVGIILSKCLTALTLQTGCSNKPNNCQ